MIRAILFDLGQVLVPFDLERGLRALAPYCPHPPREIQRRIASSGLVRPFEEGRLAPREFARRLGELLELSVSYEQFCELWSSIFLPETLVPEGLIESLAQRYRLLIVSNTNAIHYSIVEQRYAVLRHFHDRVLSYEVGALKPDQRIYREALRRAGCDARECFYTDDIPEYVEAARRLGMIAVQFRSAEQLACELEACGVRW
ncbi:MAG: HAD family phosphatase [Bryobacterales bacterium]|nr:HAD family phosphatase [Bryobacteraceae bacterium]MDW8129837.1 HAD family phosphatase [Bryobacterales bacterium]